MKKLIILMLSLIILLSNFGLSECVAVEDMPNHWIIDSYTAMADVNPDGSVSVEEYITYEFTKDFSGVLRRRIDTFTASSIDGISILEVVDIDEEDIAKSKLKQLESDSYEIIFDEEYDMVSGIDISFDQTDKKRTLVFRYTLYDLISIYSDMALLDWSFLDRGNSPSVRDISVNVCIPKSEDIESMQSFLQGPLYSQKLNKEKAVDFEASLLNGDEDLRLILLLPTSMVPEGRKKIDNEIAEKVLVEMQEYEREIELVRKEYERQQLTIKLLTYISGGLILAALVYLYIKYDRDPKTGIKKTYINELPADYYTPAELGVLINRGRVNESYIIATLIDLVNRNYLSIESSEDDNGFLLSKTPSAQTSQLKDHEKYLLVWIFDDFGQGSTNVFTKDFGQWIKNTQDQKRYKHKYKTWEDLVIKQAGNWRFFDDVKHAKVYGLIAGIVALIPGAALYVLGEKFRGFVIIGLALLLAVYSQFIEKRTEFGAANNAQWIGFKKYLRNASQSELPKPELNAWDSFLAYAIPIGRAGDVMEQIPELYDLDELKKSNLFFLHKDNLDKTDYWINSIKKDNRFWVKIRDVFSLIQYKNPRIDKIDKKG